MYTAVTRNIQVTVLPEFLRERSNPEHGQFFWAYTIEISNHGEADVQLTHRHWKITDGRGQLSHVDGDGVVGEQPLLEPSGSHDYVSGCPLPTPTGAMEGHFRFIREDGGTFLADIPRFQLLAPATTR